MACTNRHFGQAKRPGIQKEILDSRLRGNDRHYEQLRKPEEQMVNKFWF